MQEEILKEKNNTRKNDLLICINESTKDGEIDRLELMKLSGLCNCGLFSHFMFAKLLIICVINAISLGLVAINATASIT